MMISRLVSRFRWVCAVAPLFGVALGSSAGAATLFGFATSDLMLPDEIEHGCVPWEGYGFDSGSGSFEHGGTLVVDYGSGGYFGGSVSYGGTLSAGYADGFGLGPGSSAGILQVGLVLSNDASFEVTSLAGGYIVGNFGALTFDSSITPFFEVGYELHSGYTSEYIFTPDVAGSVPEPGAAFLLGLGGLVFLRRVRK